MLDCELVDQGPSPPRTAPNSPASIQLLERENEHSADASRHNHDQLLSLLPASYRTESGDLAAAGRQRLASIHSWLWVAGRPLPPRPLHHQLVLGREIVVTERMDIHLGTAAAPATRTTPQGCTQERGRGSRQPALGFLFSYAALISHESDFRIAKESRLLPPEISWPGWRIFVEQLDTELIYPHIGQRFHHGELRLNRLSKIYCLRQNLLRGYLCTGTSTATSFTTSSSCWLAQTQLAVMLTAMQVGHATAHGSIPTNKLILI
ncbi:hypothetical protein EDB80DRAFT_757747 [Ilyonectria destructans]|nr:hypothetical protein EDB80DRAFT_757747 [Ilyonectria destructans]